MSMFILMIYRVTKQYMRTQAILLCSVYVCTCVCMLVCMHVCSYSMYVRVYVVCVCVCVSG